MTDPFPGDDIALTHILVVSAMDPARSFYRDVLGAEFLTPPVDHGAEVRAFFRDPDGHLLEISEVPGAG